MAGNGVPASQMISTPTPPSLYAPHPILMETKKTEPRWLAVLSLLPEDRPVLFLVAGLNLGKGLRRAFKVKRSLCQGKWG